MQSFAALPSLYPFALSIQGDPNMNIVATGLLLGVVLFGCGSSTSDRGTTVGGTGGTGGVGSSGSGGNNPGVTAPLFNRAECGSITASDLKPSTSQAAPTGFAIGQLVAGRVDPASLTNQEHYWAIQLAPGFFHLVLDGRTADGASSNLGIVVTRRLANGHEERLAFGNELARRYRDEAFFQVTAAELVALTVTSNFGMEDYLMGVFENGTPIPSPLFDKCPTVTPLTVGTPASFTLGAEGTAGEDKWFLVDLNVGDYTFMLDAALADGSSTNLIYYVDVLDRVGQEPRAMRVVFENKIGVTSTAQGTLAVSDMGASWVRLRNGTKDLNITMTIAPQQSGT
jgi:hypothetical protein